MTVETLDHLEVLARLCHERGWALCLCLDTAVGKLPAPREEPSHLSCLDVIRPKRKAATRTMALATGKTLASAIVWDAAELDRSAELCLEALAPMIEGPT